MEAHQNISLYEASDDCIENEQNDLEDDMEKLSIASHKQSQGEFITFDDSEEETSGQSTSKYTYSENHSAESSERWKSGHERSEKKGVPKILELRRYQLEMAEKPLKGENCVIVSPTGSGKTIVAIKIIQHHLENRQRGKKIAFIVDKNNLANQQSERILEFLQCNLKVISGDIQREVEGVQDWDSLVPNYDVFVCTAKMLLNALENPEQSVNIKSFCLFIFDECHHCGKKNHPFQQIMNHYRDTRVAQNGYKTQLPQIIGFTASLGVGKASALEHITEFLAIMDADALVTVKRNKQDLENHVNNPEQFITRVPGRKLDEFGTRLKSLMEKTERFLVCTGVGTAERNAVNPPFLKGNAGYTHWLEDSLRKAQAKLTDPEMSRTAFTIKQYLQIYNEALIHYPHARAIDALNFIKDEIEKFPKQTKFTEVERQVKKLLEDEYTTLEACALDRRRTDENPLLVKLKEIILNTYAEDSNMRAIVFVRTRAMTEFLASWIEDTDDLKHIKAQKYTGAKAPIKEGGMTRFEQVNALELFREGEFKVIMATTIAEEGLDIKECNLIVRYDYAASAIAMMQARGRGRAKNSRFYILASENNCVAEKEQVNIHMEPVMNEAMERVQQQIEYNGPSFLAQKQALQREMKRERDLLKQKQLFKINTIYPDLYSLRCLKCNAFVCMSNDIRKILNHHYACIRQDLKYSVICTKFDQPSYPGEDIEMGVGQMDCKGKGCSVKLGTIARYQGVYFPVLSIKALKIAKDMMQGDTLKKWSMVEKYFKVPDLTMDELEKLSNADRLVEFE